MAENTQLMVKEVSYLAAGEEVRLSGAMVKNYLTRGNGKVTDQELVMFMNLCKYQQLNPFLNEAYLVKYGDNQPANIVVGKEAFMKRAEEHPSYDGMRAGIIVERKGEVIEIEGCFSLKDDVLLGGWCEVYRKDRTHPIKQTVSYEEYNKNQSTWKSMPKTMIRKVAIVQALRDAFPTKLGDMYVQDEYIDVPENTPQNKVNTYANKEELIIEETQVTKQTTTHENSVPTQEQMTLESPVTSQTQSKKAPF